MLHDWPSSFLESLSITPISVKRYTPVTLPYRIIIHSLPGYTFSSPTPLHRDLRIKGVAAVVNTLMVDLRFGSGYVAQGGDIGSKVSRVLGAVHPECKAVHINFRIMPEPEGVSPDSANDPGEKSLVQASRFGRIGSAYAFRTRNPSGHYRLGFGVEPASSTGMDW